MTDISLTRLLSSILASQQDDGQARELGEQRVREILSGSQKTNEELKLLLQSPAARRQFYLIADVIRAEQLAQWQQSGIDNVVQLKAAAQYYSKGQPVIIDSNSNFVVTLFPPEETTEAWTIHLKLTSGLLTGAKGICVKDSSGRVWLTGNPDEDGEISQYWNDTQDPLTVLQTEYLIIEPY